MADWGQVYLAGKDGTDSGRERRVGWICEEEEEKEEKEARTNLTVANDFFRSGTE